jgi:hypothetical protein
VARALSTAALLALLAASLAGCVVYQPPPAAYPAYSAYPGGYYAYPAYPYYPAYPAYAPAYGSVSLGFGFGDGFRHRHWR